MRGVEGCDAFCCTRGALLPSTAKSHRSPIPGVTMEQGEAGSGTGIDPCGNGEPAANVAFVDCLPGGVHAGMAGAGMAVGG